MPIPDPSAIKDSIASLGSKLQTSTKSSAKYRSGFDQPPESLNEEDDDED